MRRAPDAQPTLRSIYFNSNWINHKMKKKRFNNFNRKGVTAAENGKIRW